MRYLVACEEEGLPTAEVEADDFEEAAQEAMEQWESGGTFAGDPMPGSLVLVVVRDEDNETKKVRVDVDWEPTYYARELET